MRAWMAERLPLYMVPNEWRVLGRLPLTATGKIMRKDLRNREIERQRSG